MKKLKEIKLMIEIAQQGWSEIDGLGSTSMNTIVEKKERLKNLLEDTRDAIERWLFLWDSKIIKKISISFLENLLSVSEKLRNSYTFPGYSESYYIIDTIEMAKR
jgi:hypothetical protein